MIMLSTLMWFFAFFFAVIGFLRGWNKELIAAAGISLTMFALFQFDSMLRSIFFAASTAQIFIIQMVIFAVVVGWVYQTDDLGTAENRDEDDYQSGVLGSLIGFVNGYFIGGTIWYFLDINEYPIEQFITAPSPQSISSDALSWIPLVIVGGGASGTGDLLAFAVLVLIFLVLISI